ncbi:MAG: SDR family oxidoreductase [Eubacteriales bacterium]|nr:SDR family oxidoreductase [Eubacteriales bacterium]
MKKEELPFVVDLHEKVAVVTGGGGVICSCLSQALAACGAKVAVLDRSLDKADALAKQIVADGGKAKAYLGNVLDKASLHQAHEEILKDFGPADILLNGAGGNSPLATCVDEKVTVEDLDSDTKNFFNLEESGFQFVFNLNILGTLLPSQEFASDMAKRKSGSILNISSMNAFRPLTKIPAYSAAKAGVSNFTQWLAVALSDLNIRVNAIAPGFFSTTQNKALLWNEDGTPTKRTGKILAATPMGRFGKVEELIGATLFLLDEKSASFVTGVVLPIDGGFNAYSGV